MVDCNFNKRELELIYNAVRYVQGASRELLPHRTYDEDGADTVYVRELQTLHEKIYELMGYNNPKPKRDIFLDGGPL